MKSTSETGHAKNIGNGFEFVKIVGGYGADYNPGNPAITSAALTAKQSLCKKAYQDWADADAVYTPNEKTRKKKIAALDKLVRGVMNDYKSSGTDAANIAAAKEYADKITGDNIAKHSRDIKAKAKKAGTTTSAPAADNSHSVAQLSFDNKILNFYKLIGVLKNDPVYKTNDARYKSTALLAKYTELDTVNEAVKAAWPTYNDSEVARDIQLYDEKTGLLALIQLSKSYINGLYSENKEKAKPAISLRFRKPTKK